MKRPLDDVRRARHILDAIAEIGGYTADFDLARFEQDSLVRSATERQLTIIGEAANALTPTTRDQFPHIDWRGIRGFRNIVVHEYFGMSVRMVCRHQRTNPTEGYGSSCRCCFGRFPINRFHSRTNVTVYVRVGSASC